jgi:hypothetical protein
MVQGPGCIYAGLAWHSLIIHKFTLMSIFHQRPICPCYGPNFWLTTLSGFNMLVIMAILTIIEV